MPLTPRKLAHMAALWPRILQGRTQSVTLVCKNPDGSTSPLVVDAIWRVQGDDDPSLVRRAGNDILAIFLAADVSLAQLRFTVYAAPTTPTGAEPATRYIITSITPKGFPPGADRLQVTLTRQR
jgi:hypothetical protein